MTETADLAHLLLPANRAVEQITLRRLADVGIPGLRLGHLTLLRVLPVEGSARVSEPADAAGVTRQAIGQLVADLAVLTPRCAPSRPSKPSWPPPSARGDWPR
jgi:hypothetical protein